MFSQVGDGAQAEILALRMALHMAAYFRWTHIEVEGDRSNIVHAVCQIKIDFSDLGSLAYDCNLLMCNFISCKSLLCTEVDSLLTKVFSIFLIGRN
ncbi:hypothetical protein BUALT_BualtUnG0053600 [Buddleja alternifolia]|uniref:RNase H type-1 domain-containing protein n=1 Tax=Buddleja alternifolia TaxID=168488 RepID=A0AAV6W0J5_9LAMI|nr:hypothetical protein BUALT_BualtUnG0053600 [Buddleja alternifolia]